MADENGWNEEVNTPNPVLADDVKVEEKKGSGIGKSTGSLSALICFAFLVVLDSFFIEENSTQPGSIDSKNQRVGVGLSISSIIASCLKLLYENCIRSRFDDPSFFREAVFSLFQLCIWISGVTVLTYRSDGIFQNITSTGFFASWACLLLSAYYSFSVLFKPSKPKSDLPENKNDYAVENTEKSSLIKYKRGVTPLVAVNVVLAIGLIVAAQIDVNAQPVYRGRSIFTILLAVCELIIYLILLVFNLNALGGIDTYFLVVKTLMGFASAIIFFSTFSEPFAQRTFFNFTSDEIPNGINVERYAVVNNGFFAAVASFGIILLIVYKLHFILVERLGVSHKNKGRHILLGQLFLTSLIVFIATIMECGHYPNCQTNEFVSPILGLAFCSMAVCFFTYAYCQDNVDYGDRIYINSNTVIEITDTAQYIEIGNAVLLSLMWIGAFVGGTFAAKSPFTRVNTGYVFIIYSMMVSISLFHQVYPFFGLNLLPDNFPGLKNQNSRSQVAMYITLMSIIINAGSLGASCLNKGACQAEEFQAFGSLVVVFLLLLVLITTSERTLGHVSILLVFLLLFGGYLHLLMTTITTGPFATEQGNGFFSSWAILFGITRLLTTYDYKLYM
eukprot:augustus_masked-scaffold_19-processed-gene-2.39-mRNA-1 protein AED:1.00 eAED:1.00 QI:0/-1/0/0/-1/1/1/0/616